MNAKKELLKVLDGKERVICATIHYSPFYEKREKKINLKKGYTEEDFEEFLKECDFNYDNSYGTQELYGIIWLENGAWMERGEYDGSEWWRHVKCPNIHEYLL